MKEQFLLIIELLKKGSIELKSTESNFSVNNGKVTVSGNLSYSLDLDALSLLLEALKTKEEKIEISEKEMGITKE